MNIVRRFKALEKKDKVIFFLFCSMLGGGAIGIINFVLSLVIPSFWFFINAVFDLILAFSRGFTITKYMRVKRIKDKEQRLANEYKHYLQSGVLLIILGIIYFFVSSYMCYKGTNTNMHEYITYLVALSAFCSIGNAIYGMVKYTRNSEPIIKGIKLTNFANALTSIVLTQVVLLDTYAKGYDSTLNGYTGMGVSLVIILLGLGMIITGKRDM